MRINGVWIGWGLGDWSHFDDGRDNDPTVRKARAYMRAMFRSYAGHLKDNNKFDQELYDAVIIMQDKLVAKPMNSFRLKPGEFVRGALDLPTQQAMGFKKVAPVERTLPIIFTVEGHMSNMFFGPCAQTAEALQLQGVARWKPVGDWNTTKIPFDNKSGVEALYRQLSRTQIEGPPVDVNRPDGPKVMWEFGPEVPWGGVAFSQGAMVFCEFMWKYVLPPNAPLHYRLKTFRRGLMLGNPRRAKNAICAWAQSPPDEGTSGIMTDKLFDAVKEGIGDRWAENANDDDMFAEVDYDRAGQYQTAIAKIITEGKFFGGSATIFPQVLAMMGSVPASLFGAVKAAFDAIMFLAKNPNPHYATFATAGDIEWMRGVSA